MLTYTVYQLRNNTFREALISDPVVSWLLGRRILNADVSAEPSAPEVGDTYLIPDDATGPTWSLPYNRGKLVTWTPSGIWEGINAPDGLFLTYADTGGAYVVGFGPFDPGPGPDPGSETEVTIGVDAEATRDALLLTLADNTDVTAEGASTNVINLTYNTSPITLSKTGDTLITIIGTTFTLGSQPENGDTLTVGSITYSFVDSAVEDTDITIGEDTTATITNAGSVIDGNDALSIVDASGNVLSLNFAVSPAILTTTVSGASLTLGGAVMLNENPVEGDTLIVGNVTYSFVS